MMAPNARLPGVLQIPISPPNIREEVAINPQIKAFNICLVYLSQPILKNHLETPPWGIAESRNQAL
jgi:hypothetical protein